MTDAHASNVRPLSFEAVRDMKFLVAHYILTFGHPELDELVKRRVFHVKLASYNSLAMHIFETPEHDVLRILKKLTLQETVLHATVKLVQGERHTLFFEDYVSIEDFSVEFIDDKPFVAYKVTFETLTHDLTTFLPDEEPDEHKLGGH